jgi:hypothetical protein
MLALNWAIVTKEKESLIQYIIKILPKIHPPFK